MALTLLEAAKLRNNPLQLGVIETFARESVILEMLPFLETKSDSYSFNREATLGRADFRALNEEYTEDVGKLDKVTETLTILGGFSDVDRVLVKTSADSINDVRAIYDTMKAKAIALKYTKTFVKGDCESSPKEFDGLQVRCGSGDQLIAAGSTGGGDALSLAILDQAIDAVDGSPDVILMNKTMARRMSVGARASAVAGDVQYTIDQFGKRVTTYNGIRIGVVDTDESNELILPFTEACPGGGAATGTSIYIVKFGLGTHVCGLECGPITVEDLGIQNNVCYRTLQEWICGMACFHPRSVARLYGISDAAITA
ncbi:MAG TPA: phage major capsid protein [Desulfobacteraceae bacterium]|nr:phage major capsid protein [Desulfobacteraceae bacterium]